MGLGPKQSRFVAEYLVDLNATQAAIRAGYSKRTAHSQGPRLLENVEVAAAVQAALKRRADRVEVKQDDVLRELLRIMNSDIADAFNADGSLKPIHEIPEETRRAISAVEVDELWGPREDGEGREQKGWTKKIKFWSKDSAIEKAMKHLGLLVDKIHHANASGEPLQFIIKGPG